MSANSDNTARERELVLQTLTAAVSAIGSVVGSHTEIVLHDLANPEKSVLAIANGHVTGRRKGSPVLAGPLQDRGMSALLHGNSDVTDNTPVVIPDYQTTSRQGQTLRSATALYRDSAGQPFAALCINSDISELLNVKACIESLISPGASPAAAVADSADMAQLMNEIIEDARKGLNDDRNARKQARLAAVRTMHDRGMFIVKGSIEKAAEALGVTRYTIYNYLEEIRADGAETEAHSLRENGKKQTNGV